MVVKKELNLADAKKQDLTEAEYFSILADWFKNYISVADYHVASKNCFTLYIRNDEIDCLIVMDKYHTIGVTDYYIYLDIYS